MKHHLMIGTWTPPGVIITVAFDDEKLTLELVKKTDIPKDEPISWMTFDVGFTVQLSVQWLME
jgi:carboxy-cis,cis-muconate cyclase